MARKPKPPANSALADHVLAALSANRYDTAARAAVTDLLIDEGPSPLIPEYHSTPGWLRLTLLYLVRAGRLGMTGERVALDPYSALHTWYGSLLNRLPPADHQHFAGFDHYGSAWALGRRCFISEPYATHAMVIDQALVLEDFLWPHALGVGLQDGRHLQGRTRRMILLPLLPPPKRAVSRGSRRRPIWRDR